MAHSSNRPSGGASVVWQSHELAAANALDMNLG